MLLGEIVSILHSSMCVQNTISSLLLQKYVQIYSFLGEMSKEFEKKLYLCAVF